MRRFLFTGYHGIIAEPIID